MILEAPLILLVEDEFLIRDLVESHLKEAGYTVLTCDNGVAAIDLIEREHGRFGGLVTDVNLGPPRNGWVVAAKARELNPALPVIYVTGDSSHEWAAHGVPHSLLIAKPFVPTEVTVALASLRAPSSMSTPVEEA